MVYVSCIVSYFFFFPKIMVKIVLKSCETCNASTLLYIPTDDILGRLLTSVRETFAYGIRHILFVIQWSMTLYASLNHNQMCRIPYEMPHVRESATSLIKIDPWTCSWSSTNEYPRIFTILLFNHTTIIFKGTGHDFCWSGKPICHLQKQGNIHIFQKK